MLRRPLAWAAVLAALTAAERAHDSHSSRHFKEDGFRLQCLWDGGKVQLAYALASPMAPLVMLPACGLLQVFKPSAGTLARC
ncbi:unnamed protein product [Effrenium voratum]|nr:unnamed protein product [Effrenium voratum]